jgi:hypothetical protein
MIRIRVDQRDVDTLAEAGTIGFAVPLGGGQMLRCRLDVRETRAVQAAMEDGTLRVVLPRDRAEAWMTTDAVSLDAQIEANGQSTRILVEKDLGCEHGDDASGSSETSTFDHLRE